MRESVSGKILKTDQRDPAVFSLRYSFYEVFLSHVIDVSSKLYTTPSDHPTSAALRRSTRTGTRSSTRISEAFQESSS